MVGSYYPRRPMRKLTHQFPQVWRTICTTFPRCAPSAEPMRWNVSMRFLTGGYRCRRRRRRRRPCGHRHRRFVVVVAAVVHRLSLVVVGVVVVVLVVVVVFVGFVVVVLAALTRRGPRPLLLVNLHPDAYETGVQKLLLLSSKSFYCSQMFFGLRLLLVRLHVR